MFSPIKMLNSGVVTMLYVYMYIIYICFTGKISSYTIRAYDLSPIFLFFFIPCRVCEILKKLNTFSCAKKLANYGFHLTPLLFTTSIF